MDSPKQNLEKTLPKFLQIRGSIVRINSVPTPSAQSATLCDKGNEKEDQIFSQLKAFIENSKEPEHLKALVCIMFQNGLRVSEALKIRSCDVNKNLLIRVRGLKNSNDRIIQPIFYRNFWESFSKKNLEMSNYFNRFFIYRICKKYGLSFYKGHGKNLSVTHSGRHIFVREMENLKVEEKSMSSAIGHKSSRSTKFYTNGNKK
jgi:integrase